MNKEFDLYKSLHSKVLILYDNKQMKMVYEDGI